MRLPLIQVEVPRLCRLLWFSLLLLLLLLCCGRKFENQLAVNFGGSPQKRLHSKIMRCFRCGIVPHMLHPLQQLPPLLFCLRTHTLLVPLFALLIKQLQASAFIWQSFDVSPHRLHWHPFHGKLLHRLPLPSLSPLCRHLLCAPASHSPFHIAQQRHNQRVSCHYPISICKAS